MTTDNNYSFELVEEFFKQHNIDSIYHNKREHYFNLYYPELYDMIISQTSFLGKSSFVEKIYCYTNNITERAKCLSCGKYVSFRKHNPREYHRYCNNICALNDMKTLLGVDNASQLESVKQKKIETCLMNHGVKNPSHSEQIKRKISAGIKQAWDNVYDNKDFTTDGLSRKQYSHRAMQYADTQYRRNKHTIDPDGLRSKDFHLDHIYSVTDGFINNVPINIISDITNLRIISDKDNYKKHKSSHKTITELYEDYYNNQGS